MDNIITTLVIIFIGVMIVFVRRVDILIASNRETIKEMLSHRTFISASITSITLNIDSTNKMLREMNRNKKLALKSVKRMKEL